MTTNGRWKWAVAIMCAGTLAMACSEDEVGANQAGGADDCEPHQTWNPVQGICVDGGGPAGDSDVAFGDDAQSSTNQTNNQQGIPGEQPVCGVGNPPTSISGVVHIPSGELPLPEVAVYVPRGTPDDIVVGTNQCRTCEEEQITNYVVKTRTTTIGEFHLMDVPVGENIPLVIEVGKWRREVTIPEVLPCEENVLDHELTRLPRNRSEGEIPQFAVTTGGCDALECLLRKIGIDEAEFTTDEGDGRVHLFAGGVGENRGTDRFSGGDSFRTAWDWWDDLENLLPYDIIVHSCECETNMNYKSEQARQSLLDFTESGGRAFLSHLHYGWLEQGPADFQAVANWNAMPSITGLTEIGTIDTSFIKGLTLRDWMYLTGTEPSGEFPINETRGSIESLNEEYSQRWVWLDEPEGFDFDDLGGMPGFPGGGDDDDDDDDDPGFGIPGFDDFFGDPPDELVQYFSFNTPIDAPEESQCGRLVFSDIHVASGQQSSPSHPFPQGCTNDELTPQEKALVFMLFDLSRCIVPDKKGAF